MKIAKQIKTIDQYLDLFPPEVKKIMGKIRATIRQAAPRAIETIKYGIPTFVLNGNLVHFGGYKNHVGFYPAPSGIEAFKKQLVKYQSGKGTIRFPINKPVPFDLIKQIVKFRVKQNLTKDKR